MSKKKMIRNGTCIVFSPSMLRDLQKEMSIEKEKLGGHVYLSQGAVVRLLCAEAIEARKQRRKDLADAHTLNSI